MLLYRIHHHNLSRLTAPIGNASYTVLPLAAYLHSRRFQRHAPAWRSAWLYEHVAVCRAVVRCRALFLVYPCAYLAAPRRLTPFTAATFTHYILRPQTLPVPYCLPRYAYFAHCTRISRVARLRFRYAVLLRHTLPRRYNIPAGSASFTVSTFWLCH